jgi:hypothetical protein
MRLAPITLGTVFLACIFGAGCNPAGSGTADAGPCGNLQPTEDCFMLYSDNSCNAAAPMTAICGANGWVCPLNTIAGRCCPAGDAGTGPSCCAPNDAGVVYPTCTVNTGPQTVGDAATGG